MTVREHYRAHTLLREAAGTVLVPAAAPGTEVLAATLGTRGLVDWSSLRGKQGRLIAAGVWDVDPAAGTLEIVDVSGPTGIHPAAPLPIVGVAVTQWSSAWADLVGWPLTTDMTIAVRAAGDGVRQLTLYWVEFQTRDRLG